MNQVGSKVNSGFGELTDRAKGQFEDLGSGAQFKAQRAQGQFERMLQANIRRAIADAGGEVRLWQRDGVIVIRVAQDSAAAAALTADRIAERARDIMGIARVCRAVRVAKDPDAAIDAAVALMAGKEGSFAVRARRRDKRFPVTSA